MRTLLQILDLPDGARHVELKVQDGRVVLERARAHRARVRELSKKMPRVDRRAFKRLSDS